MKKLSEDSMVAIEGGNFWALFGYDCDQCEQGIAAIITAGGAAYYLIAELGFLACCELFAAGASDPTLPDTLVQVWDWLGDKLSHCGPCWQQLKE